MDITLTMSGRPGHPNLARSMGAAFAGYDISMSRGIEERIAAESTLEGHTRAQGKLSAEVYSILIPVNPYESHHVRLWT